MEFSDVIEARRSVRAYSDRMIPPDVLDALGRAVALAPTACNRQPFRLEVVFDAAVRAAVCTAYARDWLAEAPAIVLAYGNEESAWHRYDTHESAVEIDLSIAMEHLVLAAADKGLGTCWICAFDQAKLNALMHVESPWRIYAITPLGYPADPAALPPRPERKALSEVFQIR